MTPAQRIFERLEIVHKEICELASGKRKWEMCIPLQKTDSDILLQSAVDIAGELLELVEKQREALASCAHPNLHPVANSTQAIAYNALALTNETMERLGKE